MRRVELNLAYLFWLPSLVGIAGLHRFYLGKPVSGFLYLVTAGLFGVGTVYDAVFMPQIVREVRRQDHLDRILDGELPDEGYRGIRPDRPTGPGRRPRQRPQMRTTQQAILSLAEERHGIVTPGRVALAAEISAEKARTELDRLVKEGFADVRVSRDGIMLYIVTEFLDETGRSELDSLT